MKGKLAAALAVVAALVIAAFVRPPRATPAFSFVTSAPLPTLCCERRRGPNVIPSGAKRSRGTRAQRGHPRHRSSHRKQHRPPPPHDVDLNHADAATLARIPGVGEGLAQRIVAYRNLVGTFESLSDLEDLDGISASRLDTFARYVVVR